MGGGSSHGSGAGASEAGDGMTAITANQGVERNRAEYTLATILVRILAIGLGAWVIRMVTG